MPLEPLPSRMHHHRFPVVFVGDLPNDVAVGIHLHNLVAVGQAQAVSSIGEFDGDGDLALVSADVFTSVGTFS